MDSALLKVFVSVADTGSLSGAAKELNYVQSNVTARIKQLEEYLDKKLFHRKPRGVALTTAGERLLGYARDIVRKIEDAEVAMKSLSAFSGRLRIGSTETNAVVRLAPILSNLHEKYPDIDLELFTATTEEVNKMLLDYKVDVAFISGEPEYKEFEILHTYPEEMVLVECIDGESADVILSFKRGCTYRRYLERYMKDRRKIDYRVMEFGSMDTILGCVAAGMGKTILPMSLVEKLGDTSRLKLTELEGGYANIPTYLVARHDAPPMIDIDLIIKEI